MIAEWLLASTMALVPTVQAGSAVLVDSGTGKPLARAEVTIVGSRGAIRADDEGRFEWPAPAMGVVVIVVVLPDGRATPPSTVRIDRDGAMRIVVNTTYGETVRVQGAAPAIDVAGAASLAIVSGEDIRSRHPATLAQTLDDLPGVAAISEGQSQTPAIRGLARGRTLVLLDGVRVSTERGAGANASFLDPADLERVEVARGPGSVAYGSDAFGGVIAARTTRPSAGSPMRLAITGTLGAGMPERRAAVEWSDGYESGGFLVGVRRRAFDDYTSPNGDVPVSSWDDVGGRIRWDHRVGPHAWTLGWQGDAAQDIGHPRSDSNAIRAVSPFERSQRLSFGYEGRVSRLGLIRIDGLLATAQERLEQDRLPAPGRPRRIDRSDTSARDFQVRAAAERDIGAGRWQFGTDVNGRFGVRTTDTAFAFNTAGTSTSTTITESIEDARRTDVGLFAQGELAAGNRTVLSGGVRGDLVTSRNRGGFFGDSKVSRAALSGVASVTHQWTDSLSLTGQVARGFREPTLSDRFSRGPVGRGFLEGNPDLRPEYSLQFDVHVRFMTRLLVITAAGYHYRMRDLVERYAAGADLFRMRNRGQARLSGVEIEASIPLPAAFAVEVRAETSRGEDPATGAPIDDIAPERLGVTVHRGFGPAAGFVRATAVGAHHRAGPSEVATPGYLLIDAGFRWPISPNVDVVLAARNLTNAEFHSSAGPRWVWAPGRQVVVTASFGLGR